MRSYTRGFNVTAPHTNCLRKMHRFNSSQCLNSRSLLCHEQQLKILHAYGHVGAIRKPNIWGTEQLSLSSRCANKSGCIASPHLTNLKQSIISEIPLGSCVSKRSLYYKIIDLTSNQATFLFHKVAYSIFVQG